MENPILFMSDMITDELNARYDLNKRNAWLLFKSVKVITKTERFPSCESLSYENVLQFKGYGMDIKRTKKRFEDWKKQVRRGKSPKPKIKLWLINAIKKPKERKVVDLLTNIISRGQQTLLTKILMLQKEIGLT
jgi:hypothetical protein